MRSVLVITYYNYCNITIGQWLQRSEILLNINNNSDEIKEECTQTIFLFGFRKVVVIFKLFMEIFI